MNETVYERFTRIAEKQSNRTAVYEDRRSWTFGELKEMADRMAAAFPKPVSNVGIVMSHRAEMVAAMLAVLKTGARYVPAEPSFPRGRIRYMMQEADVDFVLTEPQFVEQLPGQNRILLEELVQKGESAAELGEEPQALPEDPAYVLYTSGTTGRPKGVCVRNENVCHYADAFAAEFHPNRDDIMLQYSVCSFDIFVEEVFASLLNGAALAIPSEEDKADISSLMAFVERFHVTLLSGFPYLLSEMNRLPEIPKSLRLLISGGDVLRGSYVDHLLDKAEVYNTYGPSETTVCASYYRCNGGAVLDDGTYPVGHAVEGTRIAILDENGNELPDGEVGELCIYGGGVSNGYIGDHREENEVFVPQPDGSMMYRSGDLGYVLPDGEIAFLRRKDTQIMIYGKRVELAEVESRVNQCKGVREAIVRVFKDTDRLPYMTAYCVPEKENLDVADLRRQLKENLTSFMIPEYFVQLSEIPRNSNGKPDNEQLPIVLKVGKGI